MNCEEIRALLVEEWAEKLDPEAKSQLQSHLDACLACRDERTSLNQLWGTLGEIPKSDPGPGVRQRFHAMLQGYQAAQDRLESMHSKHKIAGSPFRERILWRAVLQYGFAALLLFIGFSVGFLFRASQNGHEELANLRTEVHQMRQMVTISLLKGPSASDRLKGVSWSTQVEHPDPEFLSTLMHTLDYDPSVDVRLAAVDAISRFAADRGIRHGLVKSLEKQKSPMVQIALIDLLVQLHETESLNVLKQLTHDPRQNQQVRQRAQWGLELIS